MKKIVVLVCIVALLLAVATAATASTAQWVVKFKAGTLAGTLLNNATGITMGASATPSTSGAATIGNNKANLATFVGTTYYSTERKDSDVPAPYTFNMVLAAGSLYAGDQVYITAWAPDKYGTPLPVTGWDMPATYTVTVRAGSDAINGEILASWTDAQLKLAADPSGVNVNAGFLYTVGQHSDAYAGGDVFTVTIGPVPEPGSMLALGSGLIGMLGFAIRRRRA